MLIQEKKTCSTFYGALIFLLLIETPNVLPSMRAFTSFTGQDTILFYGICFFQIFYLYYFLPRMILVDLIHLVDHVVVGLVGALR